jgi:hypothetical protein
MLGGYVILYGLPHWPEDAHRYGADLAGLMVIPMGVVSAAASTGSPGPGTCAGR